MRFKTLFNGEEIRTIVFNKKVFDEFEYNINDVYVSVPTIINSNGAKEIVELHLTDSEYEEFKKSCNKLKSKYKEFNN